jgi:hypothetical protein
MARVAVELLRSDRLPAISQQARRCWEQRFTQERYQRAVLDALRVASERTLVPSTELVG